MRLTAWGRTVYSGATSGFSPLQKNCVLALMSPFLVTGGDDEEKDTHHVMIVFIRFSGSFPAAVAVAVPVPMRGGSLD